MSPPISVGLPVFNGEKYLVQAIDSILQQTFADFELIISDNASDDRTQEICRDYADKDARIVYHRQPVNIGAPKNFNFVFEKSRAQYFKWASDNDLCDANLLKVCKDVLDRRPDVVLCYGRTMTIDQDGNVVSDFEDNLAIDDSRPSRRFRHVANNMVFNNVHAGLFRSDVLRQTMLDQPYPMGDLVLIAELALYGRFCEAPEVKFYRREVPGVATKFRSTSEVMKICSPGSTPRRYWPTWRSMFGYFQVALRSPIALSEKAIICAYLLKRCYRSKQKLFSELSGNLWI